MTSNTSETVIWEDPPKPKKGGPRPGGLCAEAESLIANPNRWGIVRTCESTSTASVIAWRIKGGSSTSWRLAPEVGRFNAVRRGGVVYARFVPRADA